MRFGIEKSSRKIVDGPPRIPRGRDPAGGDDRSPTGEVTAPLSVSPHSRSGKALILESAGSLGRARRPILHSMRLCNLFSGCAVLQTGANTLSGFRSENSLIGQNQNSVVALKFGPNVDISDSMFAIRPLVGCSGTALPVVRNSTVNPAIRFSCGSPSIPGWTTLIDLCGATTPDSQCKKGDELLPVAGARPRSMAVENHEIFVDKFWHNGILVLALTSVRHQLYSPRV
jgi:hypothetical protein